MALVNTKKSALFVAPGQTLPLPPTGFVETTDPVLVVPEFAKVDIDRLTGQMNTKTSVIDICRTKTSFSASQIMRTSDKTGTALDTPPNFGLLLKCGGFNETIDTATPGEETVTYTNNTNNVPKVSAIAYMDNNKFTMTDSLSCGVEIVLNVGEPAKITNNFSGYMDSATPVQEANPAITLTDELALVVSCADLVTYDGTCLPLESVKIKTNPEIQDIYTLGGQDCGIKSNFISDYALELEATFYVDSSEYGREAAMISAGEAKEIVVKIGLDDQSKEVSGKSVVFTANMSTATTYSDSSDKDTLKRVVTYRLMDDTEPALSIKTGFFVLGTP